MGSEPATAYRDPGVGETDRRRLPDRRRRPTRLWSRFTLSGGRRHGSRRDGERSLYVDAYPRTLLVVLVAILSLSCLDAFFTLYIVTLEGGSEANPFMDFALRLGVFPFMVSKIVLTSAGLLVLCLHKNFPGVKWALGGLLGLYVVVALYHLYLLGRF